MTSVGTKSGLFGLILLLTSTALAGSATWKLNPGNSDWDTAANWTPQTVPYGESDVATFGFSNTTEITVGDAPNGTDATNIVSEIAFMPDAPAFTVAMTPVFDVVFPTVLEFHGSGITNNSGVIQRLIAANSGGTKASAAIWFFNSASAGENTVITNEGGASAGIGGGFTNFYNTSTAGNATIVNEGGMVKHSVGGGCGLISSSNANNATFLNNPGEVFGALAGNTLIQTLGSIGSSNFIGNSATVAGAEGGWVEWQYGDSAGATFMANGSRVANVQIDPELQLPLAGQIYVYGGSGYATFIGYGGEGSGAEGGLIDLFGLPDSNDTVVIANGGADGGLGATILLEQSVDVSQAQFQVFGNGVLDLNDARTNRTLGSLEGDGIVALAANNLNIGGNNLSTIFSGTIQDSGSIAKVGTGALTLTANNSYTGGTTLTQGILVVSNRNGSGTGTGPISASAGTLGGSGTIAGAVTVGTGSGAGAFLTPAVGTNKQTTLTIQSALTFNSDATYTYTFKAKKNKARTDVVIANGVTINGATLNLSGQTQGSLKRGLTLMVISNTSANPINGTFSNLLDGGIVTVNGNNLQASYSGGDGNDLTLTVVP